MLKTSVSQPYTTVNKLVNSKNTGSNSAYMGGFGSKSNKKLSKSKKSTIPDNNKATEKTKFLTFDVRETLNLLR